MLDNEINFKRKVTLFVLNEISPYIKEWESQGWHPKSIYKKAADHHLFLLAFKKMITENDVSYITLLSNALCQHASQAMAVALTSFFPILFVLHKHKKYPYCQEVIEGVLSGEFIISLAVTEPKAGSDINMIAAKFCNKASATLQGKKIFICNALHATHFLVAAQHENRLALILMNKPKEIKVVSIKMLGWNALPVTEIDFLNCPLDSFIMLGEGRVAKAMLYEVFNYERLNMAVIARASAEISYTEAMVHAKNRFSFGKSLIEHQTIKHTLAIMKIKLEAINHFMDSVMLSKNNNTLSHSDVPMLKYFATTLCCEIVDQALQVLGGYGCIANDTVERLYRDSRILRIGGGTDEMMLEIIGCAIEHQK